MRREVAEGVLIVLDGARLGAHENATDRDRSHRGLLVGFDIASESLDVRF